MTSVLLATHDPRQCAARVEELRAASAWAVQPPVHSLVAARRAIALRMPALLVADLRLQDGTVIELIRVLRSGPQPQRAQVLVLAGAEADPLLLDALQAGADNFFLTADALPGTLAQQARQTLAGGAEIAPWIARRLLDHFAVTGREPGSPTVEDLSNPLALTTVERRLLRQLSVGQRLTDLASLEGVGPRELTNRVRAIYRKMQWALRAGDLRLA
jgi:DNA-binding NarL/FixJ family response regulator